MQSGKNLGGGIHDHRRFSKTRTERNKAVFFKVVAKIRVTLFPLPHPVCQQNLSPSEHSLLLVFNQGSYDDCAVRLVLPGNSGPPTPIPPQALLCRALWEPDARGED